MKSLKKFFTPELKYILVIFLLSRVFLETAGYVGNSWIKSVSTNPTEWSETNTNITALDMWGVWDSGWYLNIAKNGYSLEIPKNAPPVVSKGQFNIGFFPLYPIFVKIVSLLARNYFVSGLIVSNTALILACYVLYKLVELENKDLAKRSIKYLFLFPTSFVLSGVFTESSFLLFLVLCFYLARKEKWWFVGIFGFFLSLTRPTGIFMVLPLALMYLRTKKYNIKKISLNIFSFLLFPLGLLTFMIYGYFLSGDLFIYNHIKETAWYAAFSNPVTVFIALFQSGDAIRKIAVFVTIELTIIIANYKKLAVEYLLLIAIILGMAICEGVPIAIGIPRMSSAIFPLFILLAKISKDRKIDLLLTGVLLSFQFILMILWSNGILII